MFCSTGPRAQLGVVELERLLDHGHAAVEQSRAGLGGEAGTFAAALLLGLRLSLWLSLWLRRGLGDYRAC
jgi:hypothetical protein